MCDRAVYPAHETFGRAAIDVSMMAGLAVCSDHDHIAALSFGDLDILFHGLADLDLQRNWNALR